IYYRVQAILYFEFPYSNLTIGRNSMATNKLTITILGAGNIGGTLGRKWHAAGHKVIFGVSNPEGKYGTELRAELGESVIVATASEALAHETDVVVMALPG